MKKKCILTGLLFFYFIQFYAQVVETLVTHPKIKDGLYVDIEGNIFTTSGGWLDGLEIGKYDINTESFTFNYFTGLNGPIDIDEKSNGDFVVTNFNINTVVTLDPNNNQITQIASGLDGPAGIAIDEEDNIYISNFGVYPLYDGHQIHKITPEGVLSVLSDSPLLFRFQAMVFNGEGELIVSSQDKLYKVDTTTGNLQVWVDLEDFGFGHMIYRTLDGCIYGTATSENKIYKVAGNGEISVFAGSFAGYQDGDLETALFTNPLGLEISPDENIIYVTDSNSLRRIIIDENLSQDTFIKQSFSMYPNPTKNGLVTIHLNQKGNYSWSLYDALGKQLMNDTSNQKLIKLDLNTYKNGVYFFKMNEGETIMYSKIIKNN